MRHAAVVTAIYLAALSTSSMTMCLQINMSVVMAMFTSCFSVCLFLCFLTLQFSVCIFLYVFLCTSLVYHFKTVSVQLTVEFVVCVL
jgi:hypothetical protein